MNILIINYEFPPLGGGASPISYELSKGYVQAGHNVDVVTMGFKGLPSYEIKEGIHIHRVKCIRKKKEKCSIIEMASYILPALKKAKQLHEKNEYDINHTHFLVPTGIIALALKKKYKLPYIVTAHGSDVPSHNTDRFQLAHYFTKPLIKKVIKNAKKVITSSNYLARTIEEIFNKEFNNIQVIPNAVDTKLFQPKRKKKIILSVGRCIPLKGHQHLIKAVHDIELDWEVHIAGDGDYLPYLKKIAKGSKTKIVFHGWVQQNKIRSLCGEAGIFTLLSKKENASIALLEAISCGCAIITTNSTGNPEIIGKAGELVEYGDVETLKKKILKFTKEYKQKGKLALKRSKEYDIQQIIKKYLEELQ